MPELLKRYPSIRAFRKQEAGFFIGRDREKKVLFNKVVAEKITLVFARSGIGKSSLLFAGLVPLLEERGFLPLDIRLSASKNENDSPLIILQNTLAAYHDADEYQNLLTFVRKQSPAYEPGFWDFFTCCHFPLASVPVFIFDQFEQFFGFSPSQQDMFMKELSILLSEQPPAGWYEAMLELNDEEAKKIIRNHVVTPDFRIVFAIRSDKIYELNRISQQVPAILRNRFELYPLEEAEAIQAIEVPAGLNTAGIFASPSFGFEPELLQQIVQNLKGSNDIIETTQLQIVCSEIENKIILTNGVPNHPEGYKVSLQDLEAIGGIRSIVSGFYTNQINLAGNEKERELARILIEGTLYDSDVRNRKVVFADAVEVALNNGKEQLGIADPDNEVFIKRLLDLRLIREDFREKKKFYEISHDYLLEAITESFDKGEAKRLEEKNRELENRNKELARLQELAVTAQVEAEQAAQIAKSQEVIAREAELNAINESRKAKWLKKRNDRLSTALGFAFILFIGYMVVQINNLKAKKDEIQSWKEKANRLLPKFVDLEAQKRYNNGDQLVAYALWDTASLYSPDNPDIKEKLAKQDFEIFVSREADAAESPIQASPTGTYIGVVGKGDRFKLWQFDSVRKSVSLLFDTVAVTDFLLLPNDNVLLSDSLGNYRLYNHASRHSNTLDDLPGKYYIPEKIEHTSFLRATERMTAKSIFLHATTLKPIAPLNYWLQKLKIKNAADIRFIGLSDSSMLIYLPNKFLYQFDEREVPAKKITRINIALKDSFILSNNARLIAFLQEKRLVVRSLTDDNIVLENPDVNSNDKPLCFLPGDSLLVVERPLQDHEGIPHSFVILNINTTRKAPREQINLLAYSRHSGLLAYTSPQNVFSIYDGTKSYSIYPNKKVSTDSPVTAIRFFGETNLFFIQKGGDSTRQIQFKNQQFLLYKWQKSDLPIRPYSDHFLLYYDKASKRFILRFRNPEWNLTGNRQQFFKAYIEKEVNSVVK